MQYPVERKCSKLMTYTVPFNLQALVEYKYVVMFPKSKAKNCSFY